MYMHAFEVRHELHMLFDVSRRHPSRDLYTVSSSVKHPSLRLNSTDVLVKSVVLFQIGRLGTKDCCECWA